MFVVVVYSILFVYILIYCNFASYMLQMTNINNTVTNHMWEGGVIGCYLIYYDS